LVYDFLIKIIRSCGIIQFFIAFLDANNKRPTIRKDRDLVMEKYGKIWKKKFYF